MPTIFWLVVILPAQLLVIVYPPVWVFWFIIHRNIERWRKIGTRAYRVALWVWLLLGGALFCFWPELFAKRWPSPWWLQAAGFVVIAAGMLLFRAAQRIISLKTLVGIPELAPATHPQPMLESGVYARTRHPIYLAHGLFILGAAAISGYAANWALLILDVALVPFMVRAEERELVARYGAQYTSYMRRVPRFFL